MIRQGLMLGAIFVGALVQLFLPPWSLFGHVKPPVLTALVIYFALQRSSQGMWMAVFWAALLQDGLSPGPFGPALLAFPLITVLVHRVRLEIFIDGIVTQMVFGAAGAMAAAFMTFFVYTINGQRPFLLGYALLRIIGSGLLGMVTLPLVARAMNMLQGVLPKPREYGWQ